MSGPAMCALCVSMGPRPRCLKCAQIRREMDEKNRANAERKAKSDTHPTDKEKGE